MSISSAIVQPSWPWLGKPSHYLHLCTPIFAVIGVALSLLHQSSLGNVITASYSPSPSLIELGVSLFVLAYGLLVFTLGARYLPVFSRVKPDAH